MLSLLSPPSVGTKVLRSMLIATRFWSLASKKIDRISPAKCAFCSTFQAFRLLPYSHGSKSQNKNSGKAENMSLVLMAQFQECFRAEKENVQCMY